MGYSFRRQSIYCLQPRLHRIAEGSSIVRNEHGQSHEAIKLYDPSFPRAFGGNPEVLF